MSFNRLEKLLVAFTILSCWAIVATAMLFLHQPDRNPPFPVVIEDHAALAEDFPGNEFLNDEVLIDEFPIDESLSDHACMRLHF